MKRVGILLVPVVATLFYLGLVSPVSAQQPTNSYDETGKGGLVQCGNNANDPCTVEDVFNIFVIATNLLIGLVGLVAIFSIVLSGYSMVISSGNTEGITKAKKNLTNAVIGLMLVFFAFILINAIIYMTLGAQGEKEDIFNPLKFIGLGNSVPPPSNNVPSNIPVNGP